MEHSGRLLINRKDAATSLSISLRRLDQLLVEGRLRSMKIGRRRLIARCELERFATQKN
jgi:excisionase family DNA binding protein